jgi:hypothetical protein
LTLQKMKNIPIKYGLMIIIITLALSTLDSEFLVDYLNLDLEYLKTKPTILITFGSSAYLFIQLLHITTCYLMRKNRVISLSRDNPSDVL